MTPNKIDGQSSSHQASRITNKMESSLSLALSNCHSFIERTRTANEVLYYYYKDLPNATDWEAEIAPMASATIHGLESDACLIEAALDKRPEFTKEINENSYHFSILEKLSQTIEGNCTESIINVIKSGNEKLAMLLLTRKGIFKQDAWMDIFGAIKDYASETKSTGLLDFYKRNIQRLLKERAERDLRRAKEEAASKMIYEVD